MFFIKKKNFSSCLLPFTLSISATLCVKLRYSFLSLKKQDNYFFITPTLRFCFLYNKNPIRLQRLFVYLFTCMIAQSFYSNLKNTINVIIIVQKGYNINDYLNGVYNIIYTIYFKKI